MLTPVFSISQDDDCLYITITAPNARISETEVQFEDQDFRFFSKPYYLRLNLPSKVVENGQELAEYDLEKGKFVIKVTKACPGEHFEGLDLLTKLLSNNNSKPKRPLIEVIGGQNEVNDQELDELDEEFDWHLEQTVREESDERALTGESYGFADKYSGVIARVVDEFSDLIDLKDPEHKSHCQRRRERLESETNDFSDEHYLSDMFDQKELISKLIAYDSITCSHNGFEFTDEQRFRLKNLPKNEYILEKSTKKRLLLSMIDILFAYAYDQRINESEASVESSWDVCKLSATLSWFDSFSSLKEVVIAPVRRSLCYPLYREWDLSLKVVEDVIKILNCGQNYVLKCFLDINEMFNKSGDGKYILNDLYITDYCVWLQFVKPSTFLSLATALSHIKILKSDIDLDLDILERAAHLAIEEQHKNVTKSESSSDGSQLMHQTSSECSSETTETSFSSTDITKTVTKDIDSDDCFPLNDDNSSHGNDSDDELSS